MCVYIHTHTFCVYKKRKEKKCVCIYIYVYTHIFFSFPLSYPVSWQQNCNLNTVLCQTHLLCQGKLLNVKLPLFPKYCLSIYFCYNTCNCAEPDRGTGKEGEQRKRNGTEMERKQSEKTMINQTTSHYSCRNQTEDIPQPL